jgi:hypothetical protein
MKPYKSLFSEDLIPGGKGDDIQFIAAYTSDPREGGEPVFIVTIDELKQGLTVEREHTDDPAKMLEIACDHFSESPGNASYYEKLAQVEETEEET